jgi:metallo-beta-lactamase class B
MFRTLLSSPSPSSRGAARLSRRRLLLAGCACCALDALPVRAQTPLPAKALAHLEAARRAAGSDLASYWALSYVIAPDPAVKQMPVNELMKLPAPPPGRAFDNLCFVGNKWVSCWAIPTSDGILLIDAMDNDAEAEHIIDAGMRQLGLNPADIRTVVITHGHGDHYGGISYLQRRYGAKAAMSEADWTMVETKLEFDRPDWGRPPKRERVLRAGERLALGDTSVEVLSTPGHTLGTVSLLFDVRDGKTTHRALLWGGTAFNFGRSPDRLQRLDAYIEATERVRALVRERNVEVFISNHASYDGAVDKLAQMAGKPDRGGAPHPFVLGQEKVVRALTVMNECARATREVWAA